MSTQTTPSFDTYGGSAAENYERFFIPAIGEPLAIDLVDAAELQAGEHVLDVACGTGIVARLAAKRVGPTGSVAGLDINPGMLAVAHSAAPDAPAIAWHEASADATSLPDAAYDAVLCQMGLQFFPDRVAALREMRRVLAPGGRTVVNVPGPTPDLFAILADGLARHVNPEAAQFVHQVFSLHDTRPVADLARAAGFRQVSVDQSTRTLQLSTPAEFLWQYLHSTPLAAAVAQMDVESRAALEHDVVGAWQPYTQNNLLTLQLVVTVATCRQRAAQRPPRYWLDDKRYLATPELPGDTKASARLVTVRPESWPRALALATGGS
jgi:ubiquinone/menaquinone biosynthesis C-methylase UbiE